MKKVGHNNWENAMWFLKYKNTSLVTKMLFKSYVYN